MAPDMQHQVDSLSFSQTVFQWRFADQTADLEKENQELAEVIQSQERTRQSIKRCLGSLETNISHVLQIDAVLSKGSSEHTNIHVVNKNCI